MDFHKKRPHPSYKGMPENGWCVGIKMGFDAGDYFLGFFYENEMKQIRWPWVASNVSTVYEFHFEVLDNPDNDPEYSKEKNWNLKLDDSTYVSYPLDNPTYHVPWRASKEFSIVARDFRSGSFALHSC
jgi:hypothetical protein